MLRAEQQGGDAKTRALITGANGHIGNHVVRACTEAGLEPVAFVRRGADLLDAESLRRACEGVELVFHVASPHRNFAADPDTIVRPAVQGTRNVLEAARAGLTRAQLADVYGRHLLYDARRAREEFGVTFRPADDVFRDAFRWLLFVDALAPGAAAKVRAALGPAAAPDPDWTR